jgi:hypothetical protein
MVNSNANAYTNSDANTNRHTCTNHHANRFYTRDK